MNISHVKYVKVHFKLNYLIVTERNFLWLGGTTANNMTPEINPFQYARVVKSSNTKGYRIVPYSGRLK